jgi:hypothetical protein
LALWLRRILVRRENRSDGEHARYACRCNLAGAPQRFGIAAAPGVDFHGEADIAVAQHQALDDVFLHHASPAHRVDDLIERSEYILARRVSHAEFAPCRFSALNR